MRIRRNAAKIPSPLSIPTQSPALAAEGDAEVAAMGGGVEMHVCELNQSPWDAMSFTPPPRLVPAELTLRRRVKIEAMTEGAEAEGEEEKRERKVAKKPIGRKKVKRKSSSEEAEGEIVKKTEVQAAAPSATCKKTDGKGWHCKREAQHPHSLCEYHLTQVRSYYSNGGCGGGGGAAAAHVHDQQTSRSSTGGIDGEQNEDKKRSLPKKKINKKDDGGGDSGAGRTRKPPTSDFYYYYSGFGPWWGRRRNGGGGVDQVTTVHDQAPEDLDLDDEDTDDVGVLGDDDGDDVSGKRRGRKPIKARSLKSLL
ncbi:unnamed protein product [Spirodela intermedia]|uniref:WRC domain-containing protein n=1 Tax=Spirodela intermedia TaxID=51605 RepID=A0A7I8ICJ6_SPIIN|nr:unnamed protein product [Spirodela intermedia]CAA6655480.1 unnamed protein product [Spirodela intermedia]